MTQAKKTQKAIFDRSVNIRAAINHGGKKELCSTFHLVADMREIITLRIYSPRCRNASTILASIWVHDRKKGVERSGTGKATGYGYHKESSATAGAINSAGIQLTNDIDGRGDTAITEALEAIARRLGYRKTLIITN